MDRLFAKLESFADNTALICQDGSTINYAELAEKADQLCAPLAERPGLLALEASNDLESLLVLVGASRANCPVLLLGPGDLEQKPHLQETFQPDYTYRHEAGQDRIVAQTASPDRKSYHPDLALLLSTSGSAGSAKLVRLSHGNLIANAQSIIEYLELSSSDRAVTTLPLHYSYGLSIVISHLHCGASILSTQLSILDESLWKLVKRHAVTSLSGVPRTYEILERNNVLEGDLPSLKTLTQAGGKLEPELVQKFATQFSGNGRRFFVMYGQTEASPRISYLPPDLANIEPDSIGQAIPGGTIRIVDNEGVEIDQANTPGELEFEGPNVMMGYANSRQDLAKGQGPKTLRTGDIAIRKPSGLFKIVGRASRFIKLSGLRINLDDVEQRVGELGVTCIATGDDQQLIVGVEFQDPTSIAQLKKQVVEKLKVPASAVTIIPYEHLPLLPSGKPNYRALKQEAKQLIADRSCRALREEITSLLNREALQDHETFYTAGGDSLSYIEANIIIEKHFGQAVPSWEKIPFHKLFALDPDTDDQSEIARVRPLDSLFIARSMAIALAMLSHAFIQFGVWEFLSDYWRLITRAATPTFLVIFGIGLARNYSRRVEAKNAKLLRNRFLPKALAIYLAIVATQLCAFLGNKRSLSDASEALLFLNNGRFIDILALYCLLYAVMPLILRFVETNRIYGTWLLIGIPWALWPFLHEFETSSYPLSLILGIGSEVGPSLPFAITFCLFGYSIGAKIQKDGRGKDTLYILTIALGILLHGLITQGHPILVRGMSDMSLRMENHPLYFAYGILAAVTILALSKGISKITRDSENAKLAFGLGANSIFSFTFGNMVLNLGPAPHLGLIPGLVLSAAFMIGLTMVTYDISRPTPRFFGPVTRWLQIAFRTLLLANRKRKVP